MPQLRVTPTLWFDTQAEEAANFYCSVFPNSRVVSVARYPEGSGDRTGEVLTVEYELDGQRYVHINGGPQFTFSEAVSLQINCADQAEVDYYWEKLGEGEEHGPCGWLKDRFGLSWQVVPRRLSELLGDPDTEKAQRVMSAMLQMRKLEVDELERAAAAGPS